MKTKKIPFNIEKAKAGAKIVTKNGLNVTIRAYLDDKSYNYPIEAIVKNPTGTSKDTLYYSKDGRLLSSGECDLDLFIEEEEKEKPRREYSGTDSIYVPKDDEGIREELIDAINGLWDNDALPMPLSLKRKTAWLAWLEKQEPSF